MCEGVVPVKPQQTTKETTMSEETYEPRREQEQEQAAELARFTVFQQRDAPDAIVVSSDGGPEAIALKF